MPVIRPGQALATLKTHLTDLLVKELMGHTTKNGPVIFEDPLAPGEISVTVIWEPWERLSLDDRNAVIHEAYLRYSRTLERSIHYIDQSKKPDFPMVPKVILAIAATWNEAVELNLLPFSIHSSFDREKVDPDEVETIMLHSGAFESPAGVQLRFPTVSLAREVQARLRNEMPEVQWTLSSEVGSVDDLSGS